MSAAPAAVLEPAPWTGSGRTGDASPLPTVSVVVPTRDRAELVQRAVASILGQQYAGDIECFVVFDGPPAGLDFPDLPPGRSLTAVTNSRTAGAAGARNTGMLAATGTLVALCDDDDSWLPQKVQRQVHLLSRHLEAVGSSCGFIVDEGDRSSVRRPAAELMTHAHLLRSRAFELHTSTLVFRRDRLMSEVGLLDEQVPGSYGEDYDWLLRATQYGPIATVADPLVRVMWHRGSWFSGQWETIIAAISYLLAKHPDFATEPRGLARLYGRLAFAHAALGRRGPARSYALKAMRLNPRERRAYISLAVSIGILPAAVAIRLASAAGRGI